MMSKLPVRKSPYFVVLLVVVLSSFTGACQTGVKGRKPSADWSRSIPVGVPVRGNIDMVTDNAVNHQVWLQQEEDQQLIHYLQLDPQANPLVDRYLELPGDQLRHPQIHQAGATNLHILWSTRSESVRGWDLRAGQIDKNGDLVGDIVQVATAEPGVRNYMTAADGQGGLYIIWEAADKGGIFGAQLSVTSEYLQEPALLVRQGESPSIVSEAADFYLTWYDEGNVFFEKWIDGRLEERDGERITDIDLGTGQVLDGPVLGISGDWAYVIWSVYSSSGLEAGTAVAKYATFSKDGPALTTGQTIRVSGAEETPYIPYESSYRISELALPASIRDTSGLIHQPRPTAGRGDELAVAITINQESRLDEIIQVGVLLFADGEFTGYQMAGKTESFSQEPVLDVDQDGDLYMAWREGGRGSLAYYALTTAEGQQALDRMSGGDLANTALSGGMEVIAGMLFFPLACIWIFPGLLLIGLLHLWRGESELTQPLTIIVILLSVIVSQVIKIAFLPTISFYVPFSAWLDISPRWEDTLRIVVPLLTLGIGLLVAIVVYRRNKSGLLFFFVLIAVDAVLTLAVYGVNFLGVF